MVNIEPATILHYCCANKTSNTLVPGASSSLFVFVFFYFSPTFHKNFIILYIHYMTLTCRQRKATKLKVIKKNLSQFEFEFILA